MNHPEEDRQRGQEGPGARGEVQASSSEASDRARGEEAQLERTLGLPGALSIGVGTMIGAGVFVFPGLAAGRAGPAASVSFALGGIAALLVALPASELATALPRSGGGYHFIRRGLGPFAGTLAGLAQWVGLIFAAAFYLAGFGAYSREILGGVGADPGFSPGLLGLAAAAVLILINVVGTRHAGAFQSVVVGLLLLVLGTLVGWGVYRLIKPDGLGLPAGSWTPRGVLPVFQTAALVFTSYLGFVQVANVGEEVKRPERNLPAALIGSVVIVVLVYVLTLVISTSALPWQRLGELEETAFVEVARVIAGPAGATSVLVAGLLATLSSANASVLSSSRTLFALSRDRVVPGTVAAVHDRFGTPHIAILGAGVPIGLLAAAGRIDILAEIASVLHLVIYGLICLALVRLRGEAPPWYRPGFRIPGHPALPLLGAATAFGLIGFMQWESMAAGAGIVFLASIWHMFVSAAGGEEARSKEGGGP
ncbi:MAG: APC family permease [bacterium]